VPLYSLCCGSRVVLSDDKRPNPLNTGCHGGTPESTDPLAQFLSEPADAPHERDRASRSPEDDHLLLAFASETAVTDASSISDASAVTGVSAVTGASTLTGASRVCGATDYRPLSALWRVVPTTAMVGLSFLRLVTRPFLLGLRGAPRGLRGIAATHVAARQGRHAVQSRWWTYPTSLFLSGAAVGAFLVMVVRVPTEDRVAAQVSAQPTTQVIAANYIVAERPASPAPTVARPAQNERPVSTSARAQESLRPGPAAVPVRTVRTRPQSFVGSISIHSRPEGADVFLNGRRVGTTPLHMPELPVGSRAVRLTMSGYSTWSRAVQVVADRRTTLSAILEQVRQ
jgi:hypothetical protein